MSIHAVEIREGTTSTVEVATPGEDSVVVVREITEPIEVTAAVSTLVEVQVPGVRGGQGPQGERGPQGPAAPLDVFEYFMPVAQTTAVIDHDLERDPVAVQVFDEFGVPCDGYGVVFTIPGQQLRLSFDVPIQARVRLT